MGSDTLTIVSSMTVMKNAAADSANARQRRMFGSEDQVVGGRHPGLACGRHLGGRRDGVKLGDEFARPATSIGV